GEGYGNTKIWAPVSTAMRRLRRAPALASWFLPHWFCSKLFNFLICVPDPVPTRSATLAGRVSHQLTTNRLRVRMGESTPWLGLRRRVTTRAERRPGDDGPRGSPEEHRREVPSPARTRFLPRAMTA